MTSSNPVAPCQPKISETRQHSPLPYRISRGEIFDADGEVVGEIFRTEAWSGGDPVKSEDQATAAFIVEAVNNHDRLTERCEQYKGQVKAGSDEIDAFKARVIALEQVISEEMYPENCDDDCNRMLMESAIESHARRIKARALSPDGNNGEGK